MAILAMPAARAGRPWHVMVVAPPRCATTLGRVITFPSTLAESYTYDAMNNLLTKTDRKQQTIQYAYDALYRLASKTYPNSTAVNYTYDVLSRLTQVADLKYRPRGIGGVTFGALRCRSVEATG